MSDFPKVSGQCPACGSVGSLFLAEGGWVTCSIRECIDPTAVATLLEGSGPGRLDVHNVTWAADLMMLRRDERFRGRKGGAG